MATYYTAHDAAGGGTGAIDDEWTLQEAADGATAGDLVLVKATGTYTPAATIDFDTNAGTILAPVTFRGANADGSDDGTVATISGSGLGGSTDLLNINIANGCIVLENIRLTAATQYNITLADYLRVIINNSRIDSATSHGVYSSETIGIVSIYDTEIDSNGGGGYITTSNARGKYKIGRCSIHDNNGDGINACGGSSGNYHHDLLYDTLIYDNTGKGVSSTGPDYSGLSILGSVIALNDGDGIELSSTLSDVTVINTILRSNGGYGINTNTGDVDQFISLSNCCSNNNTSGHIDINGGTLPGTGHITTDPKFVSETDGSEDFGLQSDSPCLNAGIDAGIW